MKQLKIFGLFIQEFIQRFLYRLIFLYLQILQHLLELGPFTYRFGNIIRIETQFLCKKTDESRRNSSVFKYLFILMYIYNFSLIAFTI